jgi:MerR family transcriptional regulator, copper efflux regulator
VPIGELAEQAGISTKATRYDEQIGILAPAARTAAGYRAYDQTALGRLGFVRAAQAVGLTLGEIRQVIGFRDNDQAPCAHVTDLLQRHAADLAARIPELQQLRGELEELAERATALDPAQCPPEGCVTSSPDTTPRGGPGGRWHRQRRRCIWTSISHSEGQRPGRFSDASISG